MKTDTHIASINPGQVSQLHRLFQSAVASDFSYFPGPYRAQVLRENSLIRLLVAAFRPSRILLGAWRNGELVGYIIGVTNGNASAKIYWLYVRPDARGAKLGTKLLDSFVEVVRSRGMERISLVTHNYEDYYRKYGFKLEGTDKLYGVDMKIMSYQWAKK
ncbi:MAG TPA: GNAT family N-acetyltransferase [Candidatus Saccharimonadales bacterium]|nr:GNAT family N-acetyltransferase [Candidatus Saccharimonadales bacterium]